MQSAFILLDPLSNLFDRDVTTLMGIHFFLSGPKFVVADMTASVRVSSVHLYSETLIGAGKLVFHT